MDLHTAQQSLIFETVAGSHAYGTNTPASDRDLRGVFTLPASHYLRMNKPPEQASDERNDTTYYSLHRFLSLASDANPNILELLFMPTDCIQKTSSLWEEIVRHRHLFISKRVFFTYGSYAVAQIKKAKGQNKLVYNPMPEARPVKEGFCWIIRMTCDEYDQYGRYENNFVTLQGSLHRGVEYPFRPSKKDVNATYLSGCHASALEHCPNIYRLYEYGHKAKGVFRGDDSADIVCESIPVEDEYARFAGILIYNKDAYERALKQWHQYWDWKKSRNESRWTDQESGQIDYDGKNMMHCMRLLYECENILENGEPQVRFAGDRLQRLMNIRNGKVPYDKLIAEADARLADIDASRTGDCGLPERADLDKISELSIKLHRLAEATALANSHTTGRGILAINEA